MTSLTRSAHDIALMKVLLRRAQELGADALVINLACDPRTLQRRHRTWQKLFPATSEQTVEWSSFLSLNYDLCQTHGADKHEFAHLSAQWRYSAVELDASEPLPGVIDSVWTKVRLFQWLSNRQYSWGQEAVPSKHLPPPRGI